jgi:hypothetical protein
MDSPLPYHGTGQVKVEKDKIPVTLTFVLSPRGRGD